MKKVININFQGQVIAIEETAYEILKKYIESLKKYFAQEEDGAEIVNDIESRIAELFGNRLKLGINCITDEDVESILNSIGKPEDFDVDFAETAERENKQQSDNQNAGTPPPIPPDYDPTNYEDRNLYRNSSDKILGGVCSGIAHRLKVDPVFIRIAFLVLASMLFWAYLILWIILKPKQLSSNISKRLYRNPNDKVIGGVCGGIAAYFKIDSWIPRLIFAVPLLFNFFTLRFLPMFPWNWFSDKFDFNININFAVLAAYVVLWIIVPKATSVKQKLELMGEKEYIKSIRNTVSDNVANVKSKSETETANNEYQSADTPPPHTPKYTASHDSEPQSERPGCARAFIVLLKIIFFAFAGLFTIVLALSMFTFILAGSSLIPLQSLFISKGFETVLLWAGIIGIFAVPALASILWLVRRIMGAKSRPVIGYVASFLWIVGVISTIVLTSITLGKFKVESSVEQYTTIAGAGNKLYVDLDNYGSDYYVINTHIFGSSPQIDGIQGLPYYTENEDSLLFDTIDLKITESSDSLFHVRTVARSAERTLKDAKRNVNEFAVPISHNDSLLLIPEFFRTPIQQGFRHQRVLIEIEVPTGKMIEVNPRLDDYKRNNHFQEFVKSKRKTIRTKRYVSYDTAEEYMMSDGQLITTSVSDQ